MKAYVIHESSSSIEPILDALHEAGVPSQGHLLERGSVDFSAEPPPGVYLNWISAQASARGSGHSVEFARQALEWLESWRNVRSPEGWSVLNGSAAFAIEISKLRQRSALARAGILVPRTVAVVGGADELKRAAREINAPFVARANRAGWSRPLDDGSGTPLFHSLEAFDAYADGPLFEPSTDGVVLLQEYVGPRDGLVKRVHIAGGVHLYTSGSREGVSVERSAAGEIERLSAAPPQHDVLLEDFDHPIIDRFVVLAQRQGIDVASLDFVEDTQGRPVALGLTTAPEYPLHLDAAQARSATGAIAALVKSEFLRLVGPPALRTAARQPAGASAAA